MAPSDTALATLYRLSIVTIYHVHLQRFGRNFQWKVSISNWPYPRGLCPGGLYPDTLFYEKVNMYL